MEQPFISRFFAHLFSVIFHPLLIVAYTFAFLAYVHPDAFSGVDAHTKFLRFLSVILSTIAFPVFTLFISWRLKLLQSLKLQNRQDRIVGYLVAMFFYWWAWYVMHNLSDIPPVAVHFLFGCFLAICGGWMCNIFYKISMHAIAMGGLVAFFILFSTNDPYASGLYLSVVILIAGLVCTARLILSDHTYFEIVTGLLIGFFAQVVAWQF
jgi:hypothetical protein